jgi:hypothetical protein
VRCWVWWGNLRERDYLEDPGLDRRIIKMDLQKWNEGMDWNDLAQIPRAIMEIKSSQEQIRKQKENNFN